MLFGKKKKSDTMTAEQIRALDKKPLRCVNMRDSDTYKETRLGINGAVNVIGNEFVLVCEGVTVMRCDIDKVKIGELMSLDGITAKGFDKESGREISVIAYYEYWK